MFGLLCSVTHVVCDSLVRTRPSKWTNLFPSHLIHSTNKTNELTRKKIRWARRAFELLHLFIVWSRLKPFEQFAVCTESVFWTLNRLIPTEVHYMEKNPGMFSSKRKKERHGHIGWHGWVNHQQKFLLKWTTPLKKYKYK